MLRFAATVSSSVPIPTGADPYLPEHFIIITMKILAVFLTVWVGCQFAERAAATVWEWQEAEATEYCHRQGGTAAECGDLPGTAKTAP
jgi:hypothetical protein